MHRVPHAKRTDLMLPYWFLFLVPAAAALAFGPLMRFRTDGTRLTRIDATWILVILVLTLLIGFRYRVGGDWENYFRYLDRVKNLTFGDLWALKDPGYLALNFFSQRLGFGMTGVNTFSGLIFSVGLVTFCRSLPRPWLALACAIPYIIIVVAMGYTRQSIALGLIMISFVMLARGKFMSFAVWVLLGALFHKTAVLMIPIAGLINSKNRWLTLSWISATSFLGYTVLLQDSVDHLVYHYTDTKTSSQGALIRLTMNATPAVIFLLYRHRFLLAPQEKKLWSLLSLTAVGMFIAFFPTSLSTALDRMALYILPLQLFVFAHLPDILGAFGKRNQAIVFLILLYYTAVMFVWLNFATHSRYWVPYQFGIAY